MILHIEITRAKLKRLTLYLALLAPLLVIMIDEALYLVWPALVNGMPLLDLGAHQINLQTILAAGIYLIVLSHLNELRAN